MLVNNIFKMEKRLLLFLFHALVVGPALILLGYLSLNKPEAIPPVLYKVLIAVGGGLIVYHGYEAIRYFNLTK
jgi:hypothetical protein